MIRSIIKLLLMYDRRKLLLYSLAVVVQSIMGAFVVMLFAPIAGYVFNKNDKISFLWLDDISFSVLALSFVTLLVIVACCNIVLELLRAKFITHYSVWIREKVLKTLVSKPYSYYISNDTAIIQQIANHYTPLVIILVNNWLLIFSNSLIVLCLLAVAIISNPLISLLFGVLGVGLYLALGRILGIKRKKLRQNMAVSEAQLQTVSTQIVRANKLVKIHQRDQHYMDTYNKNAYVFSKAQTTIPVLSMLPKYLIETVMLIFVISIMLYLDESGNVNAYMPALTVMVFVAFKVFPLLQTIYSLYNMVSSLSYVPDKVFNVFDSDDNLSYSDTVAEEHSVTEKFESLEFKGIEYSYKESSVFCYPSFDIQRGDIVALTGPSGCGKSTLMDIILGLLPVKSGEIRLNGVETSTNDLRSLYPIVGYVGQETYLMNMSIAENVAMDGVEKIDYERLKEATKQAQIFDYIQTLEDKFETQVGDNGIRLSGGQKQRIAIARALYRQPQLILLDEACSALDEATEHRIMDTLLSLPKDITIVLITHRLSSLEKIERVVNLENVSQS